MPLLSYSVYRSLKEILTSLYVLKEQLRYTNEVFLYILSFAIGSILCVSPNQVLSIIDSSYHVLSDMKSGHVPPLKDKRNQHQKYEAVVDYKERLLIDIPFLGISLMSSHPEVSVSKIFYAWTFLVSFIIEYISII